ncbi:ferredoxin [Mizugakiibacter sediminis]|uniref:Ion-translocating oxidoreductase complex subunit B n=1 Tax=Mizugakiibacter sediminis TaxID=1475481 RepID=A0A0K8QKT8_9GAMM|nr:electron transport complex subunit RsxB [Mizugakiibacter sediminis]GAP65449.1 ferredoxin [Mizugakiibacter sediminis]
MFAALLTLVLVGAAFALALRCAERRLRAARAPVTADAIDALLPQTQCGQCGYGGCRPYAEALARGEADLNRCPPGGMAGVRALANLLGRAPKPIDPACGREKPPAVALIDEDVCIGCTKCIQACPVDAIVGASRLMHTVVGDLCTGCELCVPACPVDCIAMAPVEGRTPPPRPGAAARTQVAAS